MNSPHIHTHTHTHTHIHTHTYTCIHTLNRTYLFRYFIQAAPLLLLLSFSLLRCSQSHSNTATTITPWAPHPLGRSRPSDHAPAPHPLPLPLVPPLHNARPSVPPCASAPSHPLHHHPAGRRTHRHHPWRLSLRSYRRRGVVLPVHL